MIELFYQIAIFAGLDDSALEQLATPTERVTYSQGEVIV